MSVHLSHSRCVKNGDTYGTAVVHGLACPKRLIPLVCGGTESLHCHMTLTYLFKAETSSTTNIAFFAICFEKTVRDIEMSSIGSC